MIRAFQTHHVREQTELSGLWEFSPLGGDKAGEKILTAVPGCWESLDGFENYRGVAKYTRTIECGGNIRFLFKGVSHSAKVYFDEELIAEHYNAYTPFEAIVTGAVQGNHELSVYADNSFSPDSALHVPNDYYTYGGINRAVAMEAISDVYIEWVHATPVLSVDGWNLELELSVKNVGKTSHSVIPISGLDGQSIVFEAQTIPAGTAGFFKGILTCPQVVPYELDHPRLYMLNTVISCDGAAACDDLIERVGFREVRVEGSDILFNGKKLLIKGFCRHEDHPQFGCALPFQAIYKDVSNILAMGANSIRTAHYPNDEIFLDICDELGILVWEENHARGLTEEQMRNPNFRSQCRMCIDEMIQAHYNHPSIYIWGILNECASETEYGRECYAEQFEQIRKLDRSRPVSFASFQFYTDICLDLVDVVSYNIYPEWYVDTPSKEYIDRLYEWVQTTAGREKPFLITEIGAGGIYGSHSPAQAKWTEARQASILENQLSAVFSHDKLSGVYVWQYCDVRVCEEWAMKRPRTMNNKGVVDEYRRFKQSYETVKRVFLENVNATV